MREGLIRPLWLAAVVLAFCLPLFVGLSRTDLENDEAIYSYAVDEILATGNWLNPPLSPHKDWTFLEKPPLKFWIVAAPIALGLLPHNETGLRVWDALFGGMAFLYVFALGRRLAGPICGLLALLVLFLYSPLLFEHGLRNNNMEAPLVLCYCGAVYHYLRWATEESPRRRWHIAAACGYFFLGFMTKFVASFFLPVLLGVATMIDRPTRVKLMKDRRLWLAGCACFLVLAAPWFIYQMTREGMGVWRVMLSEHVYLRFTSSLDASHIKAWSFYFTTVFAELQRSGTAWLAVVGGALLVVQTVRERRLEQWVLIAWFAVPMALMSIGTSKLHHYVYPFLPPIALAAGYGPAWVVRSGGRYVELAMDAVQRRVAGLDAWGAGVRHTLVACAVVAAVLSVATFVFGQVTWKVGDTQIFRNSHVARPLVVAVVLATLAGRGMLASRLLWPLALLLAIVPVNAYEDVWRRLSVEHHPLRSARDCLLRVRGAEQAAGRPAPGVYAIGEQRWFLHSYYYYLRHVGSWESAHDFNQRAVDAALLGVGMQRPIILEEEMYQGIKARYQNTLIPRVVLGRVLLLTPGPYAGCGLPSDRFPSR